MEANSSLIRRIRSRLPVVRRSTAVALLAENERLQQQITRLGGNPAASEALPAASPFFQFAPPGHYYSPIPPIEEAIEHVARVYSDLSTAPPGVDFRLESQFEFAAELAPLCQDFDPPVAAQSSHRYFSENDAFGIGDARVLQAILRHLRPKRIIEIGSGFSSAVMLDTIDQHLDTVEVAFIEPYQDRLRSLLRPDDLDRVELVAEPIQRVDLARFEALESGDVLFIDSTHVVRPGGDVTHDVFEVLPRLKPGVVVHFHDMFFPFEYSVEWIREGRVWAEAYLVRAFLQYNDSFEVMLFPHQLQAVALDRLKALWPTVPEGPGSLWLRRVN